MKYIVIALLATSLAACNEPVKKITVINDTVTAKQVNNATAIPKGKIDPVCEMAFDSSWNEYTVYNNDTIKFCSDNCKNAFLARPKKYIKTL